MFASRKTLAINYFGTSRNPETFDNIGCWGGKFLIIYLFEAQKYLGDLWHLVRGSRLITSYVLYSRCWIHFMCSKYAALFCGRWMTTIYMPAVSYWSRQYHLVWNCMKPGRWVIFLRQFERFFFFYNINSFDWGLPSAQGIMGFSSHNNATCNSDIKWMHNKIKIMQYTCKWLIFGYWLYFVVLCIWHRNIDKYIYIYFLHKFLCVIYISFINVEYWEVFVLRDFRDLFWTGSPVWWWPTVFGYGKVIHVFFMRLGLFSCFCDLLKFRKTLQILSPGKSWNFDQCYLYNQWILTTWMLHLWLRFFSWFLDSIW